VAERASSRDVAFREFFDAEFRPLRRLGYLLTGNWTEAEDLAQETMVRVYRAWGRIAERDRPGAYARSVMVNRHRSMLRRTLVEAKYAVHRATDPIVEDDTESTELFDALKTLPLRERQAIVLRFFEDLPVAEVAKILGIPAGTVKSMTHRALGRLREVLGPEQVPEMELEDV
jgi:RNA polymerase sigma-70 factor (sigma-E family)